MAEQGPFTETMKSNLLGPHIEREIARVGEEVMARYHEELIEKLTPLVAKMLTQMFKVPEYRVYEDPLKGELMAQITLRPRR